MVWIQRFNNYYAESEVGQANSRRTEETYGGRDMYIVTNIFLLILIFLFGREFAISKTLKGILINYTLLAFSVLCFVYTINSTWRF